MVHEVQQASLQAVGARFTSWDPDRAERRAALVERLLGTVAAGLPAEAGLAAGCAAQLLDIGASIDYYRRHAHSARIVADANLDGYSHRTLALVAAAVLARGRARSQHQGFAPLLDQPISRSWSKSPPRWGSPMRWCGTVAPTSMEPRSNGATGVSRWLRRLWTLGRSRRRPDVPSVPSASASRLEPSTVAAERRTGG